MANYHEQEERIHDVIRWENRPGHEAALRPHAEDWLRYCSANTYYAKSYVVPSYITSLVGCFIFVSTPEANRQYTENLQELAAGRMPSPAWHHFKVYFVANAAFLNFAAFSDSSYTIQAVDESLGVWLKRTMTLVLKWDPGQWDLKFGRVYTGEDQVSLRMALLYMVSHWVEVASGHCLSVYRGLDVFVKIMTSLQEPPYEAHWIVNSMFYTMERRPLYRPEHWFYLRDWYCQGQLEGIDSARYPEIPLSVARQVYRRASPQTRL